MHSSVLTQHRDPFQQQGAAASTKVVSNKKVVVLGCGFAGAAVAAQLDTHFDVTVVSRHEEFVHYIGGLRAAVVPGFEKKVTIPLDNLLTRGTLLKGVEAVKVLLAGSLLQRLSVHCACHLRT
jgi:aspartate oxidase